MPERTHTNETIVCNTEREARIANIIMEQPLACWGTIPTKVVICPNLVVPATITGNKEITLIDEGVNRVRKSIYQDDITNDGNRYITFNRFVYFWLEDRQ